MTKRKSGSSCSEIAPNWRIFIPRNGDHVEVRATVSLYTPRGDFQLNAEAIRHAGAGSLYEAFLRLKAKLEAEGLFEQSRKRPLPLLARTIGIVTSPKAAALRDILTTLYRRAPHISVILYPAAVRRAPTAIVQAIETASERAECDVLLICRGGGSVEDLVELRQRKCRTCHRQLHDTDHFRYRP